VSEAACFACGVAQPYGQIRCDVCGEPLVFPKKRRTGVIEPTEADIGRAVLYTGNRYVGGKPERGVITGFNHWTVFVRYGDERYAKATNRADLEWANAGESEAHARLLESAVFMEGFARGADMRFAAIEARLKALEERDEPQARNEPDEGIRGLERDDPAV
jgi:hypothetical protein